MLRECGKSRARILLPFVVLALETGARYNTIRTLQWFNVDFTNRCLKFGKDKTRAGTGRTVPLNQRALETLKLWAQQFPNRLPEHYVFPSEKAGAAGDAFEAKVYSTDPTEADWRYKGSMGRGAEANTAPLPELHDWHLGGQAQSPTGLRLP